MGFDDEEIVALSGAHTLGRCHADRSGFVGPWTERPLRFDHGYFTTLLKHNWSRKQGVAWLESDAKPGLMMLPTDYALVTDQALLVHTKRFAADEKAFFAAFSKAFTKLQENGHAGHLIQVSKAMKKFKQERRSDAKLATASAAQGA